MPRKVSNASAPHLRPPLVAPAAPLAADELALLARDTPARVRLGLQQRASTNIRRHLLRAVRRFAALVVADLASFYAMRAVLRAVRDGAVLGYGLAGDVRAVLPSGIRNGWQYAVALFVGLVVVGAYGPGDQRRDPRRLFAACALATALPLWATLWTRGVEPVLLQYAATVVLVWLALVAERLTIDRVVARVYPPDQNAIDTLFVGPAGECIAAASSPAFATGTDYRPIGFVDVQIPPAPGALGHVSDMPLLLAASGAQVVALCGYVTDKQFQDVVDVALAGGCQVLAVPRAAEVAGVHPTTVWRRGQPLVQLTAPSLKGPQLMAKRVVDLIGAGIGLVVLSPVIAMLAVLIKLGSPGPVFFTQERVGQGGRRFKILKFRTMVNGADGAKSSVAHLNRSGDPRLFKIPNDPRVTRIGRWFRRWSLDGLPQLWNVLLGH